MDNDTIKQEATTQITNYEYEQFKEVCGKVFQIFNNLDPSIQMAITYLYKFTTNNLPPIIDTAPRIALIKWYLNATYGILSVIKYVWYDIILARHLQNLPSTTSTVISQMAKLTFDDLVEKIPLPLNSRSIVYASKMLNDFYDSYVILVNGI